MGALVSEDEVTTALLPGVARPLTFSRRLRRRGPRSFDALVRRSRARNATSRQPQDGKLPYCSNMPSFDTSFTMMHANIRGFISHRAELEASISLLPAMPSIVCLNETFLDKSVLSIALSGYVLLSRRDGDCNGGGIAIFIHDSLASSAVLAEHSEKAERSWIYVHTDHGPVLVGVWYRPPNKDAYFVESLTSEWLQLSRDAIGTIIVGDLNVHHLHWLKFSSHTAPEGTALYRFCSDHGFTQHVREPTREGHLLDLVLSDLEVPVPTVVLPKIADHGLVLASFSLGVPSEVAHFRDVWQYAKADWAGLNSALAGKN